MAYPQRSDLNAPKITRFTGQEYGQATQQVQGQQITPVGRPPTDVTAIQAAAQGHDFPQLPPMNAPTANPREPLTAGMAMGPGPGPEALAGFMNNRTPQQADLERMRPLLATMEALANLADTSDTFRTFYRQLRGQVRRV